MSKETLFQPEDVVSVYTDAQAVDDGCLVAINRRDRVTRSVWEYLARYTPTNSQPPDCWPVEMMGWFTAGKISKQDALKMIAEHGKDEAQRRFEKQIRDQKAKALAGGLIDRESRRAREVYEQNIDGGIHAVYAKVADGKLKSLDTVPNGGDKFWLIPNENGGTTLMFPEDY